MNDKTGSTKAKSKIGVLVRIPLLPVGHALAAIGDKNDRKKWFGYMNGICSQYRKILGSKETPLL
jgi:hypothetical protein